MLVEDRGVKCRWPESRPSASGMYRCRELCRGGGAGLEDRRAQTLLEENDQRREMLFSSGRDIHPLREGH